MALTLMYITNSPDIALVAQKYGVDRIWIDLETMGKEERQNGMNTVKSQHKIEDINRIVPLLTTSEMLVRVNPWNEKSCEEIDAVVNAGADLIMLPMWKSAFEVTRFISAVKGRAKTVLLLETREAEECLDDILTISGIDEIHIGLNDLHLSYGMTFMFELLSDGTVERICKKIKKAGLHYGFGGIAKIGEGALPAEKIILEHYRLGSTRAILSRSFCNAEELNDISEIEEIFKKNMKQLRDFESYASTVDSMVFNQNINEVRKGVDLVVELKRGKELCN